MGRELHGRGQPGSECSMGTEFQCGTAMKLWRLTATERCAKYYRLNCTPTNRWNSQLGPEDVLPQKVKMMWWSAQDLWNSDGTPGNGSTTMGGEDVPFLPQKPPGVARKNRGHCGEEAQSSCGAPRRANRAFALGHLSHLVTISVFLRDRRELRDDQESLDFLAHSMNHIFVHFSKILGTLWLLVPLCLSAAGDICNTLWWNAGQGTSCERGSEANCF